MIRLQEAIQEAIDDGWNLSNPNPEVDPTNPDTDPSYDWDAARQRVARAIEACRRGDYDFGP